MLSSQPDDTILCITNSRSCDGRQPTKWDLVQRLTGAPPTAKQPDGGCEKAVPSPAPVLVQPDVDSSAEGRVSRLLVPRHSRPVSPNFVVPRLLKPFMDLEPIHGEPNPGDILGELDFDLIDWRSFGRVKLTFSLVCEACALVSML